MATLHLTETELAGNLVEILDQVHSGMEIVIERNSKPFAVLRTAEPRRRKLSEIAASLSPASTAVLDSDYAEDVQLYIERHRESLDSSESD